MKRLVRNGQLLIVILLVGLALIMFTSGSALANDEEEVNTEEEVLIEQAYTAEEKMAAINAANAAILKIPPVQYIVGLDQPAIGMVAEARALVEIAKEQYGAVDSDFSGLAKLMEAEHKVSKLLAIKAAQNAIAALPPLSEITEEHRAAVAEARALVDIAMVEYGATRFDICWFLDALQDAEDKLGEEPEPTPTPTPKPKPDDRVPTPPTGGLYGAFAIGVMLAVSGFMFTRRRKGRH
ncbi:MAG: hypothetical protein SCJ97_06685 [Bacillota bacterium]|nr:hypothetical protein [Bacillota bacterium]